MEILELLWLFPFSLFTKFCCFSYREMPFLFNLPWILTVNVSLLICKDLYLYVIYDNMLRGCLFKEVLEKKDDTWQCTRWFVQNHPGTKRFYGSFCPSPLPFAGSRLKLCCVYMKPECFSSRPGTVGSHMKHTASCKGKRRGTKISIEVLRPGMILKIST